MRVHAVTRLVAPCLAAALTLTSAPRAHAEPAPAGTEAELDVAREHYRLGVEHVKRLDWARGLGEFEKSAKRNAHATTTFNIAACERALGNYVRALRAYKQALEQDRASPGQLAPSLKQEAEAILGELNGMLAHAIVTIDPPEATLAVDGRPLAAAGSGPNGPLLEAGVEPPGRGRRAPAPKFELVLNPGAHVFTLTRKGFADAVVAQSFAPGTKTDLRLTLARLPATIRVSSNVPDALVRVGGADIGPVPVDVKRPAGTYRVVVTKDGYDPAELDVTVQAGELSDQRAKLKLESHPVTKEWWFWAAGAGVVIAGAIATYALTRPDPQPPAYDGGSTGWVARPSGFAF